MKTGSETILLRLIENDLKVKVVSPDGFLDKCDATINLSQDRFSILPEINRDRLSKYDLNNALGPYENLITVDSDLLGSCSIKSVFLESLNRGDFYTLSTIKFSETASFYYRLFIPVDNSFDIYRLFDLLNSDADRGNASKGIFIKVSQGHFSVKMNTLNDIRFAVIESENRAPFETFAEIAFNIKVAIGYISSYLIGGSGFYMAYDSKGMIDPIGIRCQKLRPPIKLIYQPITHNAYSRTNRRREVGEKFYPLLRGLKCDELNNLVQFFSQNTDFRTTILLIIESMNSSLLVMPIGLSVALEQINHLYDQKELPGFNDRFSKLADIGKKLKKGEALNRVFVDMEINLNEQDLKTLQMRNDLLHGRMPIADKMKERNIENDSASLHYCGLQMYTLLSMAILKLTGFDNYVINYVELNEDATRISSEEPTFRKLS